MAIAIGGFGKANSTFGTTVTTASTTTSATGSTFLCFIGAYNGPTFSSLVDSKSNTYTLVTSNNTAGFGGITVWCYSCVNGTGGSGHTATVTMTADVNILLFFVEITGAQTTSPIDQYNSNGSNSTVTTAVCATVTTTNAHEMVLSYYYGGNAGNPAQTITDSGSGFSIVDSEQATGPYGAYSKNIVSTTGTYGDTFTQTSTDYFGTISVSLIQGAGTNSAPIAWIT